MTLGHSIPIDLGMAILTLPNILGLRFILRPIILLLARRNKLPRTAQQTVQPEKVEALQHRQQGECDDIRNPAFVLLCFPVELVGAHGAELG